jgi:hypothetical protein
MYKNVITTLALGVAVLGATASVAADRNVTIVNQTGYAVIELYGSNAGTSSWEEDILDVDILPHGSSVSVNFDDGTGHCMFDFKAVFEDGDEVIEDGVDVCSIGTFTFN